MACEKVVKGHKKYQVYRMWVLIGVYYTQFSVAYSFLCPHFWARCLMLVSGDRGLPVLTSGNWLIKYSYWVITGKWPVKLYLRLFTYFTFYQNPKKNMILSCCTRFLEHCCLLVSLIWRYYRRGAVWQQTAWEPGRRPDDRRASDSATTELQHVYVSRRYHGFIRQSVSQHQYQQQQQQPLIISSFVLTCLFLRRKLTLPSINDS